MAWGEKERNSFFFTAGSPVSRLLEALIELKLKLIWRASLIDSDYFDYV